jgi:hypothetical protein
MKTLNTRNRSSSCAVNAPDTRAVCVHVQYWLGNNHTDPLLTPLSLVITVARNKCEFFPPHWKTFAFLKMYCHQPSSQAPPHTVTKLHRSRQLYSPQKVNQPAAFTNVQGDWLCLFDRTSAARNVTVHNVNIVYVFLSLSTMLLMFTSLYHCP